MTLLSGKSFFRTILLSLIVGHLRTTSLGPLFLSCCPACSPAGRNDGEGEEEPAPRLHRGLAGDWRQLCQKGRRQEEGECV